MATWNPDNVVLTLKGQEILSKVQAGVGKITVSKVVTGGGYVSASQLYKQTAVTDEKQTMTIVKVVTDTTGSEIALTVTNESLTQEYDLYQIGIYVQHQDYQGDILYTIAQCDTSQPDHIPLPSVTVATLQYSVYMEHSNASDVEISVNPAGFVTLDMIDEPNGVAGLDENGKLKEDSIPDSVAVKDDLFSKPSYHYVANGTDITTVLANTGITPFWSAFSSLQGPSNNVCEYFVYPELNEQGTATGKVYIQAVDLSEYKVYSYYGVSTSVSSSSWNEIGGGGSSGGLTYLTCSTSAGTGSKVATAPEGFELATGASFVINFTQANTASVVTLNVSNTGAKSIVDQLGNNINATTASLLSGHVLVVYNGTSYVVLEKVATSTAFGLVKLSDATDSSNDTTGGVAATPKAVKAAYDLANGKQANIPTGTTSQYYRGDKAWADFATAVRAIILTGLASGSDAAISATDSLLSALAKLQAQVTSAKNTAGGKAVKVLYTATLSTSWTANGSNGYMQTVSVSGILESDTPVIGVVQTSTISTNQTLLENWALVSRITTAANSITAYCYGDKPTVALPIQILCVR